MILLLTELAIKATMSIVYQTYNGFYYLYFGSPKSKEEEFELRIKHLEEIIESHEKSIEIEK